MSGSTEIVDHGWCILELMGHRRLAGSVREVTIAGAGFLRLDIPGEDGVPGTTQFYPPAALYCLTPTTEEIARAMARQNRPRPVERWELPALASGREPTDELPFE